MPRITYDFSALWKIVENLGARKEFISLARSSEINSIDGELIIGRVVKLNELENIAGLLAYEGRQVLLYIPDQAQNIDDVLNGNKDIGKKFHIAHCSVLDGMKIANRFERYIATTDVSGKFDVVGRTDNREVTGRAELYVCQTCLNMLNYKQARVKYSAKKLRENFSLSEFFETFSSCFQYLPTRTEIRKGASTYTDDWRSISDSLRISVTWTCEQCGVNLNKHKNLLHVHHVDGVKNNNARSNLRVLCKACHRGQPLHDHLYIPHNEMKVINQLRRDAGLIPQTWESMFLFADPACTGVLGLAKRAGWPLPTIEYELDPLLPSLEIAWPAKKVGISLLPNRPIKGGWQILSLYAAANLEEFQNQKK